MTQLIQHYVSRQAIQRPHHTAIVCKQELIPYAELDQITNQIADKLRSCGCRNGDRVGLLLPKSPNAIFAMLGALKADCVYVPIDPDSSAAQVARIVKSVEPKVLVSARSTTALLDDAFAEHDLSSEIQIGTLEAFKLNGKHFEASFTGNDVLQVSSKQRIYERKPTDPAAIFFPSQEADSHKGVVISHANIIYFLEWALKYFQIDEYDRLSGFVPPHSELSAFDTFGAFAAGAELHLVPTKLNQQPRELAEFIRWHELTQWASTPAVLNALVQSDVVVDGDFPSLKRMLWSRGVLPTPSLIHLMQRLPLTQFTNLYGTAETTIASSSFTVPTCPSDEAAQIPIGRPCAGVGLFVLDDELQPVALHEVGELYVGGVGLSSGYWRNQLQTDAAFVQHPVLSQRLFKTGDLARFGSDGLAFFVDRTTIQEESGDCSTVSKRFVDDESLETQLTYK